MKKDYNKYLKNEFLNFSDKRVMICGGAGFIGSNVAVSLLQFGAKVTIIDDLSTGTYENIKQYISNPNLVFIQKKIPNVELVPLFENIDICFHFAARVGVELAVKYPSELLLNNLNCTEFITRNCSEFSIPLFYSSSSEVYGKFEREHLSETDFSYLVHPSISRWAYSISKLSDEFIIYDYKRKGLKAVIGRFFNFIGPNQNSNYGMVVPKFFKQCNSGSPLTVYGDGKQRRTFCDIYDGVNAILSLTSNIETISQQENISFNIGGQKDISILELAVMIKEITRSKSDISYISVSDLPLGFDEVYFRKPNIDYIKTTCNWEPRFSLIESLSRINEYYE